MVPPKPSANPDQLSTSDRWHAVSSGFLGWTLDAFDFFVLVFLVDTRAKQFHVSTEKIIFTTTATFGDALLRGADFRTPRRPLRAPEALDGECHFFSIVELCYGFAPNYTVFLLLRAIYGIGMGGEWGVGPSPGNAECSAPVAWSAFWHCPERLFDRLFAGGGRSPLDLACLGMASHVLGGRHSRPASTLHPVEGQRIRSMETAPRSDSGRNFSDDP
jgi:hypothetical protein